VPIELSAALIAGAGVLLSAALSYFISNRRLNVENRLSISAYRALRKLLRQNAWQLRSFEAVRAHIGGFDDDELRRMLVAAGAVRFEGEGGKELWGLLSRNSARLAHKPYAPPVKASEADKDTEAPREIREPTFIPGFNG
jgi:hypothetical protein